MLEIVGLGLNESPWVVKIYFALIFILSIRFVLPIKFSLSYLYDYQKITRNIYIMVFVHVLGFPRRSCVLSSSLFFNAWTGFPNDEGKTNHG